MTIERINARLDESRSRKLELIRQLTGLQISTIVKNAIDVYYDRIQKSRRRPIEVLRDVGFVGSGEGDPNLSESYKELLGASLAEKHGGRGDHR